MSRHRGAKPDRRYGLLDPIHIIPNFHWVQTISSSRPILTGARRLTLIANLNHRLGDSEDQSRAERNPCTQEIVATP